MTAEEAMIELWKMMFPGPPVIVRDNKAMVQKIKEDYERMHQEHRRRKEVREIMEACAAPLQPMRAVEGVSVYQSLTSRTEEFVACVVRLRKEYPGMLETRAIELALQLSGHTKTK